MQGQIVTIAGKDYTLNFPSVRRAKQLTDVLGYDIFKHGIASFDFSTVIEDIDKIRAVLTVTLDGFKEEYLDELTGGDLIYVATAFFLRAKGTNAEPQNGLKPLADIINARTQISLPKDIPSMSPSTESAQEIPKE